MKRSASPVKREGLNNALLSVFSPEEVCLRFLLLTFKVLLLYTSGVNYDVTWVVLRQKLRYHDTSFMCKFSTAKLWGRINGNRNLSVVLWISLPLWWFERAERGGIVTLKQLLSITGKGRADDDIRVIVLLIFNSSIILYSIKIDQNIFRGQLLARRVFATLQEVGDRIDCGMSKQA